MILKSPGNPGGLALRLFKLNGRFDKFMRLLAISHTILFLLTRPATSPYTILRIVTTPPDKIERIRHVDAPRHGV